MDRKLIPIQCFVAVFYVYLIRKGKYLQPFCTIFGRGEFITAALGSVFSNFFDPTKQLYQNYKSIILLW